MASLAQVSRALQHVLTEVPTAHARPSGFCRRRSKVSAALFVQTVVLGWLAHPAGTLADLTGMAADLGLAVSPQGLAARYGPAATGLLEAVLAAAVHEVVAAEPTATPLLARFPAVVLLDSTTVALPDGLAGAWAGCGGRVATGTQAALKVTVRLDLCRGRLEGPALSAGRDQDKTSPLQTEPLPVGALRIGDLGYWSLAVLDHVRAGGAHFLSRLHPGVAVYDRDGTRLELGARLRAAGVPRVDCPVVLGTEARVPARLVGARVPAPVAAERRRKIRADAQREGQTPSARKLALADWTLLVTSVPAELLSVAEALVLARARWQIELLFKLWKSAGQLDVWRSADPARILCEVYAKLIALVIQHWLTLIGCWGYADRSLVRAAQTIRAHVVGIALSLTRRRALHSILAAIRRCLTNDRRITSRRDHPSAFQLLRDPTLLGLA